MTTDDIAWAQNLGRKVARRYGAGKELLEDAAQEAVAGLMEAESRWDRNGSFRGRASTRIRGAVVDYLRKMGRVVRSPRGGVASVVETLHIGVLTPESRWEDHEAVREAAGVLAPLESKIATAYYWQGQTLKEIGRSLGVTESRVSYVLAEAEAFLKTYLEYRRRSHSELCQRTDTERKEEFLQLLRRVGYKRATKLAQVPPHIVARFRRIDGVFARRSKLNLRKLRQRQRQREALAVWKSRPWKHETEFLREYGLPWSTWADWKKDPWFRERWDVDS